MLNLIKKEIKLTLHPTAFIFPLFAALVFVPNYPYEVIFFFSALSVYFTCMQSRENEDLLFTCTLPVRKSQIPLARILTAAALQVCVLFLAGIFGIIKEALLPEMIYNQAGISANIVLIANGMILLGAFNLLFFPKYYKNPNKIGPPFVLCAIITFILIGMFIVLRHATPLYSITLNEKNTDNFGVKLIAFCIGILFYFVTTFIACRRSAKNFVKTDL